MRIVFVATGGDLATQTLSALHPTHDVIGVVHPRPQPGLTQRARRVAAAIGVRRDHSAREHARRLGIPTFGTGAGEWAALETYIDQAEPDLICIATFPWVLPDAVTSRPRFGSVNVHPSLLPRHRGPNPYFWTYYRNDALTGVTIHTATRDVDAGPIWAQDRWELPRGQNVRDLHRIMSGRAAPLVCGVVTSMERGSLDPVEQDNALVTTAPNPPRGQAMINPEWDVERVWHFLAGVIPFFHEPLQYRGRTISYGAVTGFERNRGASPGTLERIPGGWSLGCRNGTVQLASRAATTRE